jgi:neutral ceramidase
MDVGVAAVDFTPQPGLILQGHLSENRSHGVLFPLEARAAIFRSGDTQLCLITLDVIGVGLATTRRIRNGVSKRTGIPEDHIIISASHTHCAPAMLKNLAMTPDESWVRSVEQAAADCAAQANSNLVPVIMGLGCGAAHFNVNRRPLPGQTEFNVNWAGVVDHRVRILRLDGSDEAPLLVLFTFSCHPTTKPGSEGWISPDYPGVARALIEKQLNCRAMFMPGTFGNIRPHINGKFTPATKEQLEAIGRELAQAVLGAAPHIRRTATSTLAVSQSDLHLNFGQPKTSAALQQMMQDNSTLGARVRANWAQRTLQRIAINDLPKGVASLMQATRIGPLALITVPGEPVQEIGYALERTLRPRMNAHDIWPIGYTNDQIGYLVTERQKQEGGYEPNAYTFYDRPAPYRDEEQTIVDTAARLFDNLKQ